MTCSKLAWLAVLFGACAGVEGRESLQLADDSDAKLDKVLICHVDQVTYDYHPMLVNPTAVDSHLDNHGDWYVEPEEYDNCWDGVDDDCDGEIDEGCNACDLTVTRSAPFWEDEDCALYGDVGVNPYPLMVGDSVVYNDADEVLDFLWTDVHGVAWMRLERQLLTLKLNMAVFGLDEHPAVDLDGDGASETFAEVEAWADALYDDGPDWRMAQAATLLRDEVNGVGEDLDLWWAETCDAASVCGDELWHDCGCVEICDGLDNDEDGSVDEGC